MAPSPAWELNKLSSTLWYQHFMKTLGKHGQGRDVIEIITTGMCILKTLVHGQGCKGKILLFLFPVILFKVD